MPAFNRFGAVYTSVVSLYPGTAAADYGNGVALAGQTSVEESIDRACDRIVAAMPEAVHNQLVSPALLLVVQRATAGQTTATLPILPAVSGTVHIWVGQPSQFQEEPQQYPGQWDALGMIELSPTLYTVNVTTGAIVLTNGMVYGDQLYASYDVDATSATWTELSLARLAIRGAAAELGARLFSQADQQWLLVEKYEAQFNADLESLASGAWVPESIRYLKWWKEVEPTGTGGMTSIVLPRG